MWGTTFETEDRQKPSGHAPELRINKASKNKKKIWGCRKGPLGTGNTFSDSGREKVGIRNVGGVGGARRKKK